MLNIMQREHKTKRYSHAMRFIAFCLLFVAAAWEYAVSVPALQNLPALLCKRLTYQSRLQGMACCPLASISVKPLSAEKCCEAPAPVPDTIPTAKNNSVCHAACCMETTSLPSPAPTSKNHYLLLKSVSHRHSVFDLKMDLRI
jgi:hypothetical protein